MSHLPTYVDISERPILRLAGPDALDLIQRISTNDVATLRVGDALHTILTTEKGKILDVVSLLCEAEHELLLLGTMTNRQGLRQWIERFVIMEDITVHDATDEFFRYQLLWQSIVEIPPSASRMTVTKFGNGNTITLISDPLAGKSAPHAIGEQHMKEATQEAFTKRGLRQGTIATVEEFYVRAGLPVPGRELSRDVNPHEAGILGLVSFTKGCYIGQEVIARLDTYKRVQKHLVAFGMNEEPFGLPQPLHVDNMVLGEITSAVRSEEGDRWIGLGFVKPSYLEHPVPLNYTGSVGQGVATVRSH